MKYKNIVEGKFISRPNRFIAHVEIEGVEYVVHVKNTGRCRELLQPGATVYLEKSDNPARKTLYDLVSVKKGKRIVNMDSQLPNGLVEEWLRESDEAREILGDITFIKREKTYGKSRFDIYVEAGDRKIFIEVKGVTLENDNVVSFPDAPTERGIKHLNELVDALEDGYETYVFFVVQMEGVDYFTPAWDKHKAFGDALVNAHNKGVSVLAYDCKVSEDEVRINEAVMVQL
ncbi:MAG: DNA/RNA nuclease SfsA [Lachnospiraceae bacterium]|nr:DNA/RNA nuclease SfsA [Lachnospiraceae bacterium]MBQ8319101.1 DNA/RNA nuclease SfsA [Lachnospiraceae bacterium]